MDLYIFKLIYFVEISALGKHDALLLGESAWEFIWNLIYLEDCSICVSCGTVIPFTPEGSFLNLLLSLFYPKMTTKSTFRVQD